MSSTDHGLYSSEFKTYFSRIPSIAKHFHSVKPLDEIPKTLPVRQFVVVNLSERKYKGSHWVIIFRSHRDIVEIFNSIGYKNIKDLRPYLRFNFKTHLSYNNTPVQLSSTKSCGLYCIYFAVFRLLNMDQPFEDVLEDIFTTDLHENENKVAKFCHHLLHISDESELYDF